MKRAHLTLKDLMAPFPVEWSGQRAQFGACEERVTALPRGDRLLQSL